MSRKLDALRNLAARPGTEAEGKLAREILERLEAKEPPAAVLDRFRDFLRTGSMDDLSKAVGPKRCECGTEHPAFTQCPRTDLHESIRAVAAVRFPRGSRVYYNRWAYTENCPGRVTGASKDWNWIRIKFDHLKNSRAVPIYGAKGWHLSTTPVDRETWLQSGIREGMERIEKMAEEIKQRYA